MDEDKIIDYAPGNISNQPSYPDDVKIGVDRFGHNVFQRKDGTRYAVYPQGTKTVYSARINPNSETEWWDEGNIARDEYGRRFSGNTPEEAQAKYEAWKRMQGATHGNWSGPEMFNALTGGIFNQLSPTQLARNLYNIAVQDPNFAEQFVNGNNGLVSDEFAANNPQVAALVNLLGDVAILGGPNAVRNVGNLVRNAKPAVENMKQVIDNARNYANYLSRVAAYNNRGRLGSMPIPDFSVTEDAAQAALGNVKNAIAKNATVDPNDIKILNTDVGKSILQNETDDVVQQYIQTHTAAPEPTAVVVEASPTPTPEPVAAEESATIIRPSEPASATIEVTQGPAAPARPKTLAERFWETHSGMFDIKFGRPGKKFGNQRGYYNIISDDNGNIVPNKIGFEGNTFTLTEEGGKPMISGEIRPGDVAKQIRGDVYNPKWYSVADQGADPNLGKVRKWFWKPAENLNAKVRTDQGDITVTGPGVDRTKLSNWLRGGVGLTGAGLGLVYGVPAIWGGIQSLFGGGGSDQPQRVIIDTNGTQYPFNSTPLSEDTLKAYINNKWVPIHPTGDRNFRVVPIKDAMKIDAYNAEQKAANQNSGSKTVTEEESDTIFAE